MKRNNHSKALPLLMAGVLSLTACTDNDYDFNEIDATIGIGGGDLSIPGGSTDVIMLDDVLELEGTECVHIRENGDYVFAQDGGDAEAVHPSIERINIAQRQSTGMNVYFSLPQGAKSRAASAGGSITADGTIRAFEYHGDKPEEVKSLSTATVSSAFRLDITFSQALAQNISTLRELSIKFPAYMTLTDISTQGSYTLTGTELKFTDVPTNRPLTINGNISELDFNSTDNTLGELGISGNTIVMTGNIDARAVADVPSAGISTGMNQLYISSNMTLGQLTVTAATGQFCPDITMSDLGNAEIGDVPDFLTDGNVVIDLYNPQIMLRVYNDMDVPGFVSGILTAVKDGSETARVSIPEMSIKPMNETLDGYTDICICRRAAEVDAADYDEVVEVSDLSNLIRTIPDNISFTAEARADDSRTARIELGHSYTVKPQYSIEAPLTFDEDARIVYTDSIDDWNEDIEDFDLADGSYITLTGTIENRVPAYLTMTAKAIDVDKNIIGTDEIEVVVSNTIVASADGENSTETPISVKLVQNKKGAMKKLDGLVLTFEADATSPDGSGSVTGKTLNANKHFIVARDIKIRLTGKIIADFN